MSKQLKCIIIDDEDLAVQLLAAYVSKVPFLSLEAVFHNPLNALPLLGEKNIDLVITDVQMPHLNGMQFGQAMLGKTMIIFVSSFRDFAVNGFELNAVDYLLKPVSFERFLQAAQKALQLSGYREQAAATHDQPPQFPLFLFVKSAGRMVRVDTASILYAEAKREYVSIMTEGQTKILTLQSMRQFENLLDPDKFMRIHKSFIIALDKVDAIERNRIIIGGQFIAIGDSYKEHFFKVIYRANTTT